MLAVWVPGFPFQLARQCESGLVGRPLGFRKPEQGRTPRLGMVDRIARKTGLEPRVPLDIALHQWPGLAVLDLAPSTRMDARVYMERHLLAYSPPSRLGRFGEGFVDLREAECTHGPVHDAAERLRQELLKEVDWNAHGGQSQSSSASRLAAKAEDRVRISESGQEAPFPDAFRRRGKGFTIREAVPTKGGPNSKVEFASSGSHFEPDFRSHQASDGS